MLIKSKRTVRLNELFSSSSGRIVLFAAGIAAITQFYPSQSAENFNLLNLLKPALSTIATASASGKYDYSHQIQDGKFANHNQTSAASIISGKGDEDSNYPTPATNNQFAQTEYSPDEFNGSARELIATQNGKDNLPDNVWERIRVGFGMSHLDNEIVRKYEKKFARNPKTMERIIDRARNYLPYIIQEVERRGLPSELALLPVIESAYNPRAYSRAGAAGLWQFMPYTGKQYGLQQNWWYEGRRDVIASTDAALRHLYDLSVVFNNDWHLALAAYNAGMYGVQREIAKNKKRNKSTDYSSLNLRLETRHFVPKLIAVKNIVTSPETFGLELPEISVDSTFEVVEFDFQVDLGIMAHATDMQEFHLAQLNPGLRRTITPPNGPYRILVPVDKHAQVLNWKASLLPSYAVYTVLYQVKQGDVLGKIAQNHNVSISAIKSVNSLNSNLIRIGQTLRIPSPTSIAQSEYSGQRESEIIYQVRKGDVLGTIAEKYNIPLSKVRAANLLYSDLIRVGQKIRIPVPGSNVVQGKTTEPTIAKQYHNVRVHLVVNGDTLSEIAVAYDVTVAQLRIGNSLSSDKIVIGQKINVSASTTATKMASSSPKSGEPTRYVYTVKSGDSLWSIARRHQIKILNLLEWNDISREKLIHAGQKFVIYVH